MKLTVVSVFNNALRYIERYFDQMDELQSLLNKQGDTLSLVLGYGDSGDGTGAVLWDETSHRFDTRLIDVSHGQTVYGSVVSKRRFKQLAKIGNTLWRSVPEDTDFLLHVESDLIWRGQTIIDLLTTISDHHRRVPSLYSPILLAPLIIALNQGKSTFYDIWAFRVNGQHFTVELPYLSEFLTGARYYDVDSVVSRRTYLAAIKNDP